MAKSRSFSIYLLKADFNSGNALKEDHDLEDIDSDVLPAGAEIYIRDSDPYPPWWKQYFEIEEELTQVSNVRHLWSRWRSQPFLSRQSIDFVS